MPIEDFKPLSLDILTSTSTVKVTEQKSQPLEHGEGVHCNAKQDDCESKIAVKVESKEEDIVERLRVKLGKIKIEPWSEDNARRTTAPTSSEPQTPTSKGFIIDSDYADVFLGRRYYFVAPIKRHPEYSEYAIFSLSPQSGTVSVVDEHSSYRSYCTLTNGFDNVVEFDIGGLRYWWNIQNDVLAYGGSPADEGGPMPVVLLNDLGEARDFAKRYQEESRCFSFTGSSNQITAPPSQGMEPPGVFTTNTNYEYPTIEGWPHCNSDPANDDTNGYFTPTEDAPSPPAPTQSMTTTERLGRLDLFFGPDAKQEDIDEWVEKCRPIHKKGNLKCPETGCTTSSRRPHALKASNFVPCDYTNAQL